MGFIIEERWKPLVKCLYYPGVRRDGMRRILTVKLMIFCVDLETTIAPKINRELMDLIESLQSKTKENVEDSGEGGIEDKGKFENEKEETELGIENSDQGSSLLTYKRKKANGVSCSSACWEEDKRQEI